MLSERYITDRYLPDKAIDLLDEAAASLSLSSSAINESYSIREELLKLKEEREEAEAATENNEEKKYERIAKIKAKEMALSDRLNALEQECKKVTLSLENIASVIEVWTGVPATTIKENEFRLIDKLEERLRSRIIGQDEAVAAVARAIKRNRAGITYKRKPVSFIFAGPTGVGKTELVKVLASDLFNTPETLIRFDMSEFMEKHSVSRLIGSPPGYVGYEEAGQLTEKIRRRPYSVVLFDEIEKAHPDVLNVLLQILDDGRVTDAQGRSVNFENAVVVMTTNAGSGRSSSALGFASSETHAEQNRIEKALLEFLRPEFINRVDEVIVFNSLSENDFCNIVKIMLGDLKKVLEDRNIKMTYTDNAAKFIAAESFSVKYGARNMRRYIQRNIEDQIAESIVSDIYGKISNVSITVKSGALHVECN
jgi:ATP-dependent Clp protease ATP-binding subunit ClpA